MLYIFDNTVLHNNIKSISQFFYRKKDNIQRKGIQTKQQVSPLVEYYSYNEITVLSQKYRFDIYKCFLFTSNNHEKVSLTYSEVCNLQRVKITRIRVHSRKHTRTNRRMCYPNTVNPRISAQVLLFSCSKFSLKICEKSRINCIDVWKHNGVQ